MAANSQGPGGRLSRWRDICTLLRSEKVMERRRGCEALKETLDPSTFSSAQPPFDTLLDAMHDCVLAECDKKENSKTATNVEAQCSSALFTVVSSANKSGTYINCTKLFNCCVEVLRCKKYIRIIGNAYVTLLNKHVLCIQYYLTQFTPHQWADLLEVAIELCGQTTCDCLKTTQLLMMIIEEGLGRCHLIIPLRDNLHEITNLYTSRNNDKKDHLQELLLEISILILNNIATESRLTVCVFIENITTHVLKFYDQTSIGFKYKKKLLFQFLKLCIAIHHPNGRIYNNAGCLAGNWDTWKSILVSIYHLVIAEAKLIYQNFEKNIIPCLINNDSDVHKEFIELTVDICHQVFQGNLEIDSFNLDINGEPSSKRCKLDMNNFLNLKQILEVLPKNFYPWISVIKTYVHKYGNELSSDDYATILQTFYALSNIAEFQQCILYNAIKVVCEQIKWDEKYNLLFNNVWNSILRKANTQSQIFDSSHQILQLLLLHTDLKLPLDILLKFYSDKSMPYCNESLKTLDVLLSNYNSKINHESLRLNIAKWILSKYHLCNNHNIVYILFKLCIKENLYLNKNKNIESWDIFDKIFEENEEFMLIVDFESQLLLGKNKIIYKSTTEPSYHSLWKNTYRFITETLLESYTKEISIFKENKSVSELLSVTDIILKFTFLLIDRDVTTSFDNLRDIKSQIIIALNLIDSSLNTYFNSIENSAKLDLLNKIKSLFECKYQSAEILKLLQDNLQKNFIEFICNLITKDSDEVDSDRINLMEMCSELSTNVENPIKSAAIDCILSYNMIENSYTDETLELILQIDLYDLTVKSDLNIIINIVTQFLKYRENIPINEVFQFLQQVCKVSFRDNESTHSILVLLYNLLESVKLYGSSTTKENCIIMLKSYLKRCTSYFYAPKTLAQALKCCSWIINDSGCHDWGKSLYEDLFKCFFSNLISIRLYSSHCLCLQIVRTNPDNFHKLLESLVDIFKVDVVNAITNVISDEGANRASTVLHCLATLSVSSAVWDKRCLAILLQIYYENNIDTKLLNKVVNLITKNTNINSTKTIIEDNQSYLLNVWFDSKRPLDKFPWQLLQYKTYEEFCYSLKKIIVSYEIFYINDLQNHQVQEMIVKKKNITKNELICECLPTLLILSLSTSIANNINYDAESLTRVLQTVNISIYLPAEEVAIQVTKKHINEIIYGLLTLINDKKKIFEDFEWSGYVPYVTNPSMNETQFISAVNLLNKLLQMNILNHLCTTEPLIVQKLLLEIWSDIEKQFSLERRIICLHRYWVFYQILPLNNPLNVFLLTFTIRSLIFLITKYRIDQKFKMLSEMACKMLFKILLTILPKLSNIISHSVPLIFTTMIENVVSCKNGKNSHCYKVIKLLLEMNEVFLDTFKKMDPLPDKEIFQDLNNRYKKYFLTPNDGLDNYVSNFINSNFTRRYEGLEILQQNLLNDRRELIDMFNDLKDIKGFSEECEQSNLHRMMSCLIDIAINSPNEDSQLEASRCIGNIGPSDFQTLVLKLPPDFSHIIEVSLDCFVYIAINEIREFIYHENPLIVKAASDALTSMLYFDNGKKALKLLSNDVANIKESLLPFCPVKNNFEIPRLTIVSQSFELHFNRTEIWYDFEYKKHSDWVTDILLSTLKCFAEEDCFLSELIDICRLQPKVSEKCFCPLIGLLLSLADESQITTINKHINMFFNSFFKATYISHSKNKFTLSQQYSETNLINFSKIIKRSFDQKSVKCMLNLVKFIRLQIPHYKWSCNKKLFSFNYLPIAWAAYLCGANFMAILCCDLWCNEKNDNIPPSNPETIGNIPCGEDILTIMRMSYRSIGNRDALSGCGSSHFSNLVERRNHYMFNKSYADALLLHDVSLSSRTSSIDCGSFSDSLDNSQNMAIKNFARSLHTSGLYHLTEKYIESYESDIDFDDIKYDCFWRMGDWSLEVNADLLNCDNTHSGVLMLDSDDSWSKHQYLCLKTALERDIDMIDNKLLKALNNARKHVIDTYKHSSLESCQSVCVLAAKFQSLQEVEYFVSNKLNGKVSKNPYSDLISVWSVDKLIPFYDFKDIETILSQRIVILDHVLKHSSLKNLNISIGKLILDYAELALLHGWPNICNRWINKASKIGQNLFIKDESAKDVLQFINLTSLVEGKVAWKTGHSEVASHLVKNVICNSSNLDDDIRAKALMQYGLWMMETRRENAQDIFNNYFKLSLEKMQSKENNPTKIGAYFAIAKFADEEYRQINEYINSNAFNNKIKLMEKCKETYIMLMKKHIQNKSSMTREEIKAKINSEQQVKIDENEIANARSEKEQYLQLAMRYYLQTLLDGDDHDLCIFRIISLWLDNNDLELDTNDMTISKFVQAIPSRKYLLVIPQITPRMKMDKNNHFQTCLHKIIERCAIEHPHHVLPILFALKHSDKDSEFQSVPKTSKSSRDSEDSFITCAENLIGALLSSKNAKLIKIINQMDAMNIALIKLANHKVDMKTIKSSHQTIPQNVSLRVLKQLDAVLVPTVTLPVRYDGNYDSIPSIVSFSGTFTLVGGINAPKKISCKGSDGIERSMLIKGEDDIRQDAVMQQVFGIVNNLLSSNQHTKQQRLLIRTYKIVVLSRRSGIIGWCNGTEPLGHLLTGEKGCTGYHAKFRPQDLPARDARKLLNLKRSSTNEEKLKAFKFILSKFKPVFHLFFMENFLVPAVWYERRLSYTHSVATTSMIGYILGLGDRHVQNILIDKSTAEVVHIDFGIAFEQGRLQPTPETVPFRLTQDMVAGLGCTGIEGVFRKSCEKTLDVLKSNQETLITILEVLIYDPLYMWTISREQAFKKQNALMVDITQTSSSRSAEGFASEAERVLSRVRSKLEGAEFGSVLATPGQVARLLQQATDVNNLSRLFAGWQPYL